ncbi:hypothetical protein BpHYR1_042904 [Brachionus plicatilis]|uniref:Uncharacterized protein n=1 Tax=Brachionus plicatilis TaxID=10195 RepID=A0A3M7T5C5_BRAPC|nr:hypothetical protein BpHYR1_042904 [Brachionus plicatilis]
MVSCIVLGPVGGQEENKRSKNFFIENLFFGCQKIYPFQLFINSNDLSIISETNGVIAKAPSHRLENNLEKIKYRIIIGFIVRDG